MMIKQPKCDSICSLNFYVTVYYMAQHYISKDLCVAFSLISGTF